MRRLSLLVTITAVTILAVVPPANAAVDYFLEIDGIPGESQDAQQADSVDVLSFSWGATNSRGRGRTQLQDLQILKNVDVASPVLFQRLAQGTQISSMELLGRRAGGSSKPFLHYCFQGVQVASIQQADTRDSATPTESVSFSYNAVSEQYAPQNANGSVGSSVFAGWNAVTNQLIASYPSLCGR